MNSISTKISILVSQSDPLCHYLIRLSKWSPSNDKTLGRVKWLALLRWKGDSRGSSHARSHVCTCTERWERYNDIDICMHECAQTSLCTIRWPLPWMGKKCLAHCFLYLSLPLYGPVEMALTSRDCSLASYNWNKMVNANIWTVPITAGGMLSCLNCDPAW